MTNGKFAMACRSTQTKTRHRCRGFALLKSWEKRMDQKSMPPPPARLNQNGADELRFAVGPGIVTLDADNPGWGNLPVVASVAAKPTGAILETQRIVAGERRDLSRSARRPQARRGLVALAPAAAEGCADIETRPIVARILRRCFCISARSKVGGITGRGERGCQQCDRQ